MESKMDMGRFYEPLMRCFALLAVVPVIDRIFSNLVKYIEGKLEC